MADYDQEELKTVRFLAGFATLAIVHLRVTTDAEPAPFGAIILIVALVPLVFPVWWEALGEGDEDELDDDDPDEP